MATAAADSKQAEAEGVNAPVPPPPYSPQLANYGTADPAPPTYAQAEIPSEPPPSYESVYGQVRAAKQESSGAMEFFKKFLIIVLGTLGCTICVGLILAIPISMIVMGSRYVHDCPREKYIPIYLIVGGCFGVLKNLSNIVQRVRNKQEGNEDENAKTNPFDGTLNCFLLAWFIAGNVWIYRNLHVTDFHDPESTAYCNPTLYWFSFWLTASTYILAGLVCCGVCFTGCIAGITHGNGGPDSTQTDANVEAPPIDAVK